MSEASAKLVEFNGTSQEKKAIEEIAKIAQKVLKDERKINVSMYEAVPTIAYEVMYAIIQYLEKNKKADEDISVNFMNLFELGVTYRGSDDGEKEGNFTPYVQPGVIMKTVIKSDEMTEDED